MSGHASASGSFAFGAGNAAGGDAIASSPRTTPVDDLHGRRQTFEFTRQYSDRESGERFGIFLWPKS
jgi:hypothetical protein